MILPNWRGCARKAARRSFNCATSTAKPAPWSTTARAIKAALAPFNVPLVVNDRIDVALAAGADGVHVGQDDMAVEDARKLLGPRRHHRAVDQDRSGGEAAPVDLIDYVGSGGVYVTCRNSRRTRRSAPKGWRASSPRCTRARAKTAGLRHCRHRCRQCGRRDRRRRRRRRRHLGAVACARSGCRGAWLARRSSMRRWRSGARDGGSGRAHHCRLGFERRCRHPGRSQDLRRARRLWRLARSRR